MRKILVLMLIYFTTLSLTASGQEKKSKNNKKEQVIFDVSMTCESCKRRIERNISFEKGVGDMKVDLPSKTVKVQFNPNKTNKEKLQKAFEELGYEAKEHVEGSI